MDNKENDVIIPEVVEEVDKIKDNAVATMHNRFVEARLKMTIEEQRIMLALISLIEPDDEDFKDYKIPVSLLQELAGTKRKDIYSAVKGALERLLKRTIVIETETDLEMFNFISYGRYKRGEGYFIVSIDKHLKPYLLKLKEKFTKIPLKYIFPLRSVYAIRLYELLKQYEHTGYRIDYILSLRDMLDIEPYEYQRFVDFDKWVLKRAIKEINEKTDLEVSYKKKRTGRKITHIEFEIKSKRKKSKIGDTTETIKSSSESVDTQGQKQAKNNQADLWATVLRVLENKYGAEPDDIDLLSTYVYPVYQTDTTPKKMVLKTNIEAEKGKQKIREVLKKYWEQIKKITNLETMGNYIPAVSKTVLEKGKELPFGY